MSRYANVDKMVIQDTLMSHNWNRDAAQRQLDKDHPVPKLAVSESHSENSKVSPPPEEDNEDVQGSKVG